jgi:predicted  nucleic acid-binding Zn ribbon protein
LYRLGKKEGYSDIRSWEINYIACDTLQKNCAVGEAFGLDQISHLDSELNQLGLKCCKEIERLTEKPSYYYLYNYRAISVEEDQKRTCPSCGDAWFLEEKILDKFDFKCTNCQLLSNLTYQN